MKTASPDKTRTTPPGGAATGQVATDASVGWRTRLADLVLFTGGIVTVILGIAAS